ncbi:MAG TPA: hypothetical protein VK995_04085, partial [Oceanipulchritudo sp.]|nr:hypothetical protein [Oceanipulchritudo sp.]
GVRVPGVLEWPAHVEKGQETFMASVTSDYFPTILEILGYTLPEKDRRPYDGISLVPLIEGRMSERPVPIGFQGHGLATFTDNRFKLVHNPAKKRLNHDNGKTPVAEWELYDLLNDKSETQNIAECHPEIVNRMRTQLEAWQASCQASSIGADYWKTGPVNQ